MSLLKTGVFRTTGKLFSGKKLLNFDVPRYFDKIVVRIFRMSASSESKYNWLISLVCPNGNHDPINLPHQEALFVGRSPETRIVDPRCSRNQVKLFGDLITGEIQVTQTASNSSSLDGIEMIKDKVYNMKHSSTLYLLAGLYPQKMRVKQLVSNTVKQSPETKHKHSTSDSYGDLDKGKKALSKDKIKSSSKRKSSFEDTNDCESKRPRLSESEIDKIKASSKRKSSFEDTNNCKSKRPRLSESEIDKKHKSKSKKENFENVPKEKSSQLRQNGSASKSEKKTERILSSEEDQEYMKTVADKLDKLKSQGKLLRTPSKEKPSTSESSAGSSVSDTKTLPQTNTGPAASSRWDQYGPLYVYTSKGLEGRSKIAGFDIDGTIIETQSGKVFPVHPGDWRMKFNNSVSKKIRKHYEDGFKIVFFTNQMGVSRGKTNMSDLKTKFGDVLEEINVPIQIFVATKGGLYRKPSAGMWDFLVEKGNDGVPIELSQSFFIGDAAGRPVNWAPKKKKDFSCSDRLFALNIGIDFHSPEEFFMGYPSSKFQLPQFDPRTVSRKTPLLDPVDARLASKETEVIILAGCPAAGKSHFSKKYFVREGYAHVNRDTLGSWQKCVRACKDNLTKGTSVIIDNTNPDVESRARYLKVATSMDVPCRCFVFNATLDQAKHNERFREITDKSHQPINDIIMNSFKGKFKPPVLSEGFTEIVKVNFVPKFRDKEEEKLYRKFLMEK